MTADELERATLVRTVDDGVAEVLGVKDDVGYLYRVDRWGGTTLVSTDESKKKTLRTIRRMAGTGILLFVGSLVTSFILGHSGSIPGWIVPFVIVGFILAFFGVAASTGPKHFLPDGESWDSVGTGWSDGD